MRIQLAIDLREERVVMGSPDMRVWRNFPHSSEFQGQVNSEYGHDPYFQALPLDAVRNSGVTPSLLSARAHFSSG